MNHKEIIEKMNEIKGLVSIRPAQIIIDCDGTGNYTKLTVRNLNVGCYHLKARILKGDAFGYADCPDCKQTLQFSEVLNGWGDWLRENVFNERSK